MKRLNNRGYMLVEIIVASVIAFSVAYYLLNLTYKFKDKSEDIYYSTTMLSDKINITKNIMNDLEKISDKSSDGLVRSTDIKNINTYTITIKRKDDKKFDISRTIKVSKDAITQQWQIEYGSFQNGAFVTNDKSYYKKVLDKSFEVSNVTCGEDDGKNAYKIIIKINSLYINDSNDIILFVNKGKSPSNTQNEDVSSKEVTLINDKGEKIATVDRNNFFQVETPKTFKENFIFLGYSTDENATNPKYKVRDSIDVSGFNKNTTLYPIWIIDPEKTFNIESNNKKFVFDVYNNESTNGTKVILYNKKTSNNANQKWKFKYDKTSGYYKILTMLDSTGKTCLDVDNGNYVNGTKVQIWQCADPRTGAQDFKIIPQDDGSYYISTLNEGYVLDVPNKNFANSTSIQVWQKNNSTAQKFYLSSAD